jgi:hypothetical protein
MISALLFISEKGIFNLKRRSHQFADIYSILLAKAQSELLGQYLIKYGTTCLFVVLRMT